MTRAKKSDHHDAHLARREGNIIRQIRYLYIMKTIRIKESQIRAIVSNIIKENMTHEHEENYMFFSNIEQIARQAKMLESIDKSAIDSLLTNGHDWASDHIAEAKSLMDQVFDFIMNEIK